MGKMLKKIIKKHWNLLKQVLQEDMANVYLILHLHMNLDGVLRAEWEANRAETSGLFRVAWGELSRIGRGEVSKIEEANELTVENVREA